MVRKLPSTHSMHVLCLVLKPLLTKSQSCERSVYTEHPSGSQVVMTAWALIGLMKAEYPDIEPIKKGVKLIMERQQPNGEWKQEAIEGVFNKSCMILYQNYKFTFPLKALGMFATKYPDVTVI